MATTTDRDPLLKYLRVQQGMDLEIQTVLQRASEDASGHLLRLEGSGIGNEIRRAQIRQAQVAINESLSKAFAATGDVIRSNRAKAASAAVDSNLEPFEDLFRAAGVPGTDFDTLLRSQRASAARSVEHAVSRVSLTSRPLSERVYHTKVIASGQLDRIITSGIARGLSASELARDVRGFIGPDTPGGVQYAANRLARTELNNAFHGTQITNAVKSPFITAMRWHLSGSHPRPDECNDYESGGDLPDGLWTPGAVPGKPHPNCLCWLEPEGPTRDQFISAFQNGDYDEFLSETV